MKQKKLFQKLAAGVALFAMSISMLSPVSVKAAEKISYPKTQVVYLPSKTGTGYTSIDVSNIPKSQTVLKVTSSKTSVVKPSDVSISTNEYTNTYFDKEMQKYNSSSTSKYAYIYFDVRKAGTATISYRIGKSSKSYKEYKTKVTVKAYENPIKSFTVTGLKDGKNLASAFKTSRSSYDSANTLKKNQSNAKIKVTSATNWKITSLSFNNYADDSRVYVRYPDNKGKSSISLQAGTIKASAGGYVSIDLYNTKTGGTMNCYYRIAEKTK